MDKTVYTVAEVQQILGIGRNAAYKLCNGKIFPVRRVGKMRLIPIKTFEAWLYEDTKNCCKIL